MAKGPDDNKDFGALFELWDRDHTGTLSVNQFISAVRQTARLTHEQFPDHEIYRLFKTIDVKDTRTIDTQEFIQWMNHSRLEALIVVLIHKLREAARGVESSDWHAIFQSYDVSHSGSLSLEEFRDAIRYGVKLNVHQFPNDDVERLFSLIDSDNTNSISLINFLEWIQKYKSLDVSDRPKQEKMTEARAKSAVDRAVEKAARERALEEAFQKAKDEQQLLADQEDSPLDDSQLSVDQEPLAEPEPKPEQKEPEQKEPALALASAPAPAPAPASEPREPEPEPAPDQVAVQVDSKTETPADPVEVDNRSDHRSDSQDIESGQTDDSAIELINGESDGSSGSDFDDDDVQDLN
jgi:Ca2+-binding EF-hand superfamily protein